MKAEPSIVVAPLPLPNKPLNSTGGLDSFPRFNELPQELRWKVWEHALPGPRIVHIGERQLAGALEKQALEQHPVSSTQQHSDGDLRKESATCGFDSDTKIPAVLLACREAFEYAGYQRSFAYSGSWPQTYFHSRKDTLFLSHASNQLNPKPVDMVRRARDMSNGCELRHVKNLALSIRSYALHRRYVLHRRRGQPLDGDYRSLLEWLDNILDSFGGVENLTLVLYAENVPRFPCSVKPGLDMVMIDPIDVHRALKKYGDPSPTDRVEERPVAGEVFALLRWCLTGSRSGNPTDSQIVPYLEESLENMHENSKWKAPKINIKVMLTAGTNDRLEKIKRRYEEVILLEGDEP